MGNILFLLAALFIVISTVLCVYRLARRQFAKAKTTALVLVAGIVVYMGALVISSLTSTSAVLALSQNKCFDEWCAAVTDIAALPADNGTQDFVVALKISNTGRGRAQRPDTPHVFVVDAGQKVYDVSAAAQSAYESQNGPPPAVGQLIQAGTAFTTSLVFRLLAGTKANLVITEGGWPTYFIIGDEGSLWHKQSLTPLN